MRTAQLRCLAGMRRLLLVTLAVSMLVFVAVSPPVHASDAGMGRLDPPESVSAEVADVTGLGAQAERAAVSRAFEENERQREAAERARQVGWPDSGEADVALGTDGKGRAAPGGLPVTVAAEDPSAGTEPVIAVMDQRATQELGITGVVLSLTPDTTERLDISVDYGDFASAFGGGWSGRLRLAQLPACAATTPTDEQCREATVLDSDNNRAEQRLSATVRSRVADAPVLLAIDAAPPGESAGAGGGDYSATPLAESSAWEAGNSSGSFGWSYGFELPPTATDLAPDLSLRYDSGSIDGRTATTNNQGSLIGEGFGLDESYIERSYGSCADDGHEDVYDNCWLYDNAQLVLNGTSSALVKGEDGQWHLENDDAALVTRGTGASNGDDNGEYWTVTTTDGMKYVFGLHALPGAPAADRTNSTWTVPVFGDDADEPGYGNGDQFSERAVAQAWRWNLDYVEDTHGNVMTYWYEKEMNYYAKNDADTADTEYVRGGRLVRIDYGQREGSIFARSADAQVRFSYAERCTGDNCSDLTQETASDWPDVPFDALCTSGADDCGSGSPTFFVRKRLTGVSTHSWSSASGGYSQVDSWKMRHSFLDPGDIGDTSDNVLVLTSITRTGHVDGTLVMQPVEFTYHMRPNRVDATDDILPMNRPRLNSITSETGAITTVTYAEPECVRDQLDGVSEDTNTRNCYPQYWNVNGALEASVDWFHKYRVIAISVADPTGHSESVEYRYSYEGAAWAYNDSAFVPADERTWSMWRGYRQVTVHTGNAQAVRTRTTSVFFQGMHRNRRADGSTRTVSVSSIEYPGLSLPDAVDEAQYAGFLRQQVTYNGSAVVDLTVNEPWSQVTAEQEVPGAGDLVARFVRTKKTTDYTYLTVIGQWRGTASTTEYDEYGMPSTVQDSGDLAVEGDETCSRTWYARNPDRGLIGLPSRTRTVARSCSVGEATLDLPADTTRRGDVLSDTATVYDDVSATSWSPSRVPTKGSVTWTGRPGGYAAAVTNGERHPQIWQTISLSRHDALGRLVSATDAADGTTTTTYVPAAGGPITRMSVRNPLGHTEHAFTDPRRGDTVRVFDANSRLTELSYDALGRLTAVWLPNRVRGAGASPSTVYEYHLGATSPSWVGTGTLRADGTTYSRSYEIFDALLRPVQSQSPTPEGGRLLTDTRYNSLGQEYETYADIFDAENEPSGTYARAEYGEAPVQERVVYDGAGRETARSRLIFGVERWTTRIEYTGDSTATYAVSGGNATRTIADARGRTVELREYNGPSAVDPSYGGTGPVAAHQTTAFVNTLDNLPSRVTASGAVWSYTYDLFGRVVETDDPDKGSTTKSYDALDRLSSQTDATGRTTYTSYDALGRTTGTWSERISDATQLTSASYDQLVRGQIDSTTRYVGGREGRSYTRRVTQYDTLYRPVASETLLDEDDPLVASGAIPESFSSSSRYRIDGTLDYTQEPALGGLPAEVIDHGYNELGLATSLVGASGYLLDVDYSALGQRQQLTLGTAAGEESRKVYITNTFESGTQRIVRSHVTDQTHPYMLQDLHYTYDDAGNVLSVADSADQGGASQPDTQCFSYDGQRRLTDAWTPGSGDCRSARSTAALGGPAPYWLSYTYSASGSRSSETAHTAAGSATTTYCYTDADRPHALSGTTTHGASGCTDPETRYEYDATGNTTRRYVDGEEQTLDWSDENKVSSVVSASDGATNYIYDGAGELLIRYNEDGESILYAGATELHVGPAGETWGQRTYVVGGQVVATRTNESGPEALHYLAGDHHGTSSLAVEAVDQEITKRYFLPFGEERDAAGADEWINDRGFLDKPHDEATGLTQLGARQYDPSIGRFLSADPVMDLSDPDQLQGYSYGNNSPLTFSDPTGLLACGPSKKCLVKAQAVKKKLGKSPASGGPSKAGRTRNPFSYTSSPSAPQVAPRESIDWDKLIEWGKRRQKDQCAADPIALACAPQFHIPSETENPTLPWVIARWMAGSAKERYHYGEDSDLARMAGMTDTAAEARRAALDSIRDGETEGSVSYSIAGEPGGVGGKLWDDGLSVLRDMVLGQQDSETLPAYLGSFTIRWEVLRESDQGIQVQFTVDETLSVSSFSHYATGYGTDAERSVKENLDGGGDWRFGTNLGPGRDVNIVIQWRQVIYNSGYNPD